MTPIVHGVDDGGNPSPPLVGALLRTPFMVVRAEIISRLHAAGFSDLQPAHLAVFQHPGPDGRTPGDVARSALASKQAMNNLLKQLETGGYLRRDVSAANRRERTITLTPRGHATIAAIRTAIASVEEQWQRALGGERYAQLRALLVQLNQGLSTTDVAAEPRPENGSARVRGSRRNGAR